MSNIKKVSTFNTLFYQTKYGKKYAIKNNLEYISPLKYFLKQNTILDNDIILKKDVYYKNDLSTSIYGKLSFEDLNKIWLHDNNLFEILKDKRKPYFDIEFPATGNKERVVLFSKIKKCIIYVFKELDIEIKQEDLFISSGVGKFENGNWKDMNKYSYHIIINNNTYFDNPDDIKKFKMFVNYIIHTKFKDLIKDNTTLIDLCVYGRNQAFKLPFNTKLKPGAIKQTTTKKELNKFLVSFGIDNNYKKIDVSKCKINFEERIKKIKTEKNIKYLDTNNKDLFLNYYDEIKNSNYKIKIENQKPSKDINYIVKSIYNNENVSYDTYFQVGSSIKRVLGEEGFNLFDKWCSKSNKYDRDYNLQQYEGYSNNTRGFTTLLNLAQICNDDLNEYINKPYLELFELNELNKDIEKKIINEKYLPFTNTYPIPDGKIENPILKYDTVFIKSPMGTGKSYMLHELLKCDGYDKNNHYQKTLFNRVVYLSSRQAFSCSMSKEFENEDIINYLDKKFNGDYEKVIISLESLNKLNYDKCDLLIIDESESIFNIISSDTLIKNKFEDNLIKLKYLIQKSKKILIMDAFLSNRSIKAIQNLKQLNKDNSIYYENTFKNNKRYGNELSKGGLVNKIREKLIEGKRCVVCSGSKTFGKDLLHNLNGINFSYLFYNNENSLQNNIDVNKEWSKVDLLIYSPSITCGISYNNPDYKFDNLFIYAVNVKSTHFRDIIQAHKRIRHFNDNNIYYHLNTDFKNFNLEQIPIHKEIIKLNTNEFKKLLIKDKLPSIEENEELKKWVLDIHLDNILEKNIHTIYLKEVCKYYFDMENIEKKEIKIKNYLIDKYEDNWNYDDIDDIDIKTYKQYNKLMLNNTTLNNKQKKEYHKFIFNKRIVEDIQIEKKKELFNYWYSNDNFKYISNIKDLKQITYNDIDTFKNYLLNNENNYIEFYNEKIIIYEHLNKMLRQLKIIDNNTLHLDTSFNTLQLEEILKDYNNLNSYSINKLFQNRYWKSRNKKGEKINITTKTIKSMLDSILINLFNYRIDAINNTLITKDKVRRRITNYKIVVNGKTETHLDILKHLKKEWKEIR